MGKESLKVLTFSRCKKRTDRDGPANYSVPSRTVYIGREWQIAHTQSCLPPCTMVALMQGAYEKEAMGKESLKMQTLCRRKQRTDLDVPAKYSVLNRAV